MQIPMQTVAEYFMEQSKKNTVQLFEMMANAVTSWVEMLNQTQNEVQQLTSRLTEKGKEQFVAQLAKLQERQVVAQTEFQEQFRSVMNLFQKEGNFALVNSTGNETENEIENDTANKNGTTRKTTKEK